MELGGSRGRSETATSLLVAGLLLGSILPLVLAGCSSGDSTMNPPPGATEDTIRITAGAMGKGALAYSPNPDTVKVGTTVRWINDDLTNHTATGDAIGTFDTGTITSHGSKTHRFDSQGSFDYHCSIHPSMVATLVVIP